MTNEEAITVLRNAAWLGSNERRVEVEEAVAVAVKVLSTQSSTDLISRQAAIEKMDCLFSPTDDTNYMRIGYNHAVADGMAIIRNLPSAQPEQRWIPCSERFPEEPFGCLVTVWDTNSVTMYEFENILPYFVGWDGEQWNDADGEQCPFEVIAWMPLPEPYVERRTDDSISD